MAELLFKLTKTLLFLYFESSFYRLCTISILFKPVFNLCNRRSFCVWILVEGGKIVVLRQSIIARYKTALSCALTVAVDWLPRQVHWSVGLITNVCSCSYVTLHSKEMSQKILTFRNLPFHVIDLFIPSLITVKRIVEMTL